MKWSLIPISLIALTSGCGTTTSNYCDIAAPLYFDPGDTIDYLSQNDEQLLRDIVVNNETWEGLCS